MDIFFDSALNIPELDFGDDWLFPDIADGVSSFSEAGADCCKYTSPTNTLNTDISSLENLQINL